MHVTLAGYSWKIHGIFFYVPRIFYEHIFAQWAGTYKKG